MKKFCRVVETVLFVTFLLLMKQQQRKTAGCLPDKYVRGRTIFTNQWYQKLNGLLIRSTKNKRITRS